eukprot:403349791
MRNNNQGGKSYLQSKDKLSQIQSQPQNKQNPKYNQKHSDSRRSSSAQSDLNAEQSQYGMKNSKKNQRNQGQVSDYQQPYSSQGKSSGSAAGSIVVQDQNPQNNNRVVSNVKAVDTQPKLIEPRSKRGVNIFTRKRKDQSVPVQKQSVQDLMKDSVINKRVDFGESGEVAAKAIQDKRQKIESMKGSLQSSRQNTQQIEQINIAQAKNGKLATQVSGQSYSNQSSAKQQNAPKANLFDIIGGSNIKIDKQSKASEQSDSSPTSPEEKSQERKDGLRENQRHQLLNQSISQSIVGINRMSTGHEIKGILKNAYSQSSQASQSIKGIMFSGVNLDLIGKKIDTKNSSSKSSKENSGQNSLRSSMKNGEIMGSAIGKSQKSDQTNKKSVKIEEKKTIPQSYMNILNKDEGFLNLKEDYPRTDTEVLADFYIKNDFNLKKTITDLYSKMRLMPTDRESDQSGRSSVSPYKEENVKDDQSDSESQSSRSETSSRIDQDSRKPNSINQINFGQRGSIYSSNQQNESMQNPKLKTTHSQQQKVAGVNLVQPTLSNTMVKQQQRDQHDPNDSYLQARNKQKQNGQNRIVHNFSNSHMSESQDFVNGRLQGKNLNKQQQEEYEMDDTSSDQNQSQDDIEEESKGYGNNQYNKYQQNISMRGSLHQRMSSNIQISNNQQMMPKTGTVFDQINNIKSFKVPVNTENFNSQKQQRDAQQRQEYGQNAYGSFGVHKDQDSEFDDDQSRQSNKKQVKNPYYDKQDPYNDQLEETLPQKDHSKNTMSHNSPESISNKDSQDKQQQQVDTDHKSPLRLQKINQSDDKSGLNTKNQLKPRGIKKDKAADQDSEEDGKNVGCCVWGKKSSSSKKNNSQQPDKRMVHEKVSFWRRIL